MLIEQLQQEKDRKNKLIKDGFGLLRDARRMLSDTGGQLVHTKMGHYDSSRYERHATKDEQTLYQELLDLGVSWRDLTDAGLSYDKGGTLWFVSEWE